MNVLGGGGGPWGQLCRWVFSSLLALGGGASLGRGLWGHGTFSGRSFGLLVGSLGCFGLGFGVVRFSRWGLPSDSGDEDGSLSIPGISVLRGGDPAVMGGVVSNENIFEPGQVTTSFDMPETIRSSLLRSPPGNVAVLGHVTGPSWGGKSGGVSHPRNPTPKPSLIKSLIVYVFQGLCDQSVVRFHA